MGVQVGPGTRSRADLNTHREKQWPTRRAERMKIRLPHALAVLALLSLGGGRPALAAGAIRVSVSPQVLLADGISSATVSAEVLNSSGHPARDGTEVRFYTT